MKKWIIKMFGFQLMQRKWGRKYIGGKFYYIHPAGLSMADFWSDTEIRSCQSRTLMIENYEEDI